MVSVERGCAIRGSVEDRLISAPSARMMVADPREMPPVLIPPAARARSRLKASALS